MPGGQNEYSRPSVVYNGCAYNNLCNYYNPSMNVQGRRIVAVPSFGSVGYGSGDGYGIESWAPCSGYPKLDRAYPNYPSNCSRFTSGLCG